MDIVERRFEFDACRVAWVRFEWSARWKAVHVVLTLISGTQYRWMVDDKPLKDMLACGNCGPSEMTERVYLWHKPALRAWLTRWFDAEVS